MRVECDVAAAAAAAAEVVVAAAEVGVGVGYGVQKKIAEVEAAGGEYTFVPLVGEVVQLEAYIVADTQP